MIDQLLAEIGIEGGSLSRMPGLIREARDMQGHPQGHGAEEAAGGRRRRVDPPGRADGSL